MIEITDMNIDKYNRDRAKLELFRKIRKGTELWRVTFLANGRKAITEFIFSNDLLEDMGVKITDFISSQCYHWAKANMERE